MQRSARPFLRAGAMIIGGCCGPTSGHLKWLVAGIRQLVPSNHRKPGVRYHLPHTLGLDEATVEQATAAAGVEEMPFARRSRWSGRRVRRGTLGRRWYGRGIASAWPHAMSTTAFDC